jgi:AcrR family transcriptional regulator
MQQEMEASSDGRNLRRSRNREAVLDAVIELFESGDLEPSVDDVAALAGVSNRSIYRYFEHRDHLIRAAVTHAVRRVLPELEFHRVGIGDFDQRVASMVDHRIHVYERLAPLTRAAKRAATTEPIIAEELEIGRMMLRQQFLDQFDEEFEAVPPSAQAQAVLVAEIAFQFESVEYFWAATRADANAVRALLTDHLNISIGRFRARSSN